MKKKIYCMNASLLLLILALAFAPISALAATASQGEDPKSKADRLYNEGLELNQSGQIRAALGKFEEALPLYEQAHDLPGEAECLFSIGSTKEKLSDYPGALEAYKASLRIWEELNHKAGQAAVFNGMGLVYQDQGQFEVALEYYKKALEIRQEMGERREEGITLNNIGGVYLSRGQYQLALDYYQQALAIREEIGDRAGEATTLSNTGLVYDYLGEYKTSQEYYEKALTIFRDINHRAGEGTTLNNLGLISSELGEYPQALDYLQQALAIRETLGDQSDLADTWNNLGLVYFQLGEYAQALNYFQRALTIVKDIGDRPGEELALSNIGAVYRSLADYRKALDYYQQALAIQQELGIREGEGTSFNNIGDVYYMLGQYSIALEHYQKSLNIRDEIGDQAGQSVTLNNIGSIYTTMGQFEQALDYHQQALAIQQEIGDRAGEGLVLNNIGLNYAHLGQYEKALSYHQRALAIGQEIGDRAGEGTAINNIGYVYSNLGQYTEALDYYQQALAISQRISDRAGEALTLGNIGYVYGKQGDNANAIKHYQQAIAVIESIQADIKVEELKSSFASEQTGTYEGLIGLLWDEGRFEEAFSYVERGRARSFLDQLAGGAIDFRAGVDADLISREQALQDEITALRTELITLRSGAPSEWDTNAIATVESNLSTREADYTQLLTDIKLQSPEVASLVSVDVVSLTDVQNLLDANTTLIEFFVMEDRTLAFIITHDTFETVGVDVNQKDLSQTIHEFRDFASRDDPHPASLKQLYAWLIAPLKDKLQTSIIGIIPHSTLHYLPFAALTDGERYLGNEYSLFTLPSASALRFIQEKRKPQTDTILALGNPTITQSGLGPLEFAGQEVEAITTMFGTEPLIGESATESALRSQAGTAGIVHLAAHGQYNAANPLFSVIYLAADGEEDGRLEVNEIYGLDLTNTTDLVVLSACETQVGEISAGDEVVGMTRAFLYAGTPSVIASLWKVDDEATTLLMERFYTHLREGMSKAQALQAAQAELRAEYPNEYAHPYYWAAFVLTGDPGSSVPRESIPVPETDNPMKWLIGLGGVGLLGLCCFGTVLLAAGVIWSMRRKKV